MSAEKNPELNAGLKLSPLNDRHRALGAKFAEFGGWSMPLEYTGAGVIAEHTAVRNGVGIFDVSHLGKATVAGPGAAGFVNRCLTNDLAKINPGKAQYTLICTESGGVVDDLIAYLKSDDEVFLIPNAANTATVVGLLAAAAPEGITVTNEHDDFVVLAVQGPRSDDVLRAAGLPVGHEYMSFELAELDGVPLTVCRTGYTGERGYELVAPSASAGLVWDKIIGAGQAYAIQPAGLGARDTLRTEMAYPLHGQDISTEISPVQARLGWAVGWDKETFFGAGALKAERAAGPSRTLRGLKAVGRGIPRPHMQVVDNAGTVLGEVTSGTFSPTLKTGIALALVDPKLKLNSTVLIDIRGRASEFVITKPPFVHQATK
ncbi:aminomethyltransferase [Microlunatus endophyticus]|uniref:Aminomethyltransferase n=1 Tax=Microlunatus endophyticus TaxID=1716077 RepID=A0A917S0B0_9ACTN|nr:glycine cleavage system aminomethyltransferase GcvT [Microlunatus endophyticus]GGL48124.1 aminomethyltransferase [Microlunatus endophyticus]